MKHEASVRHTNHVQGNHAHDQAHHNAQGHHAHGHASAHAHPHGHAHHAHNHHRAGGKATVHFHPHATRKSRVWRSALPRLSQFVVEHLLFLPAAVLLAL